jgi:hypothetical protein
MKGRGVAIGQILPGTGFLDNILSKFHSAFPIRFSMFFVTVHDCTMLKNRRAILHTDMWFVFNLQRKNEISFQHTYLSKIVIASVFNVVV